jgi:4-carboxymuconolactone decarboxylase
MTGVEAQLQAHFGMGMNTGITEQQLHQLIYIIEKNVGKKGADTGKQVLAKVIAARQK